MLAYAVGYVAAMLGFAKADSHETFPESQSLNAASLRRHLQEQACKDKTTDDEALFQITCFVKKEADRIVAHMIDKSLAKYEYDSLGCCALGRSLKETFPRHSHTSSTIMRAMQAYLQSLGFSVAFYHDSRHATMWKSEPYLMIYPSLWDRLTSR